MKINLSPRFKRSYKKLPPKIQDDFDEKIIFFAKNPRNPKLDSPKPERYVKYAIEFLFLTSYYVHRKP